MKVVTDVKGSISGERKFLENSSPFCQVAFSLPHVKTQEGKWADEHDDPVFAAEKRNVAKQEVTQLCIILSVCCRFLSCSTEMIQVTRLLPGIFPESRAGEKKFAKGKLQPVE